MSADSQGRTEPDGCPECGSTERAHGYCTAHKPLFPVIDSQPDPSERLTLYHCLICDHNAGGPTCQKCGQPADVLLGFCTLGPCTREGDPEMGDWWREQHKFCTGSHHLGAGEIMLCDCTCHATREDWFKIAHFVHGEPVEELRDA